MKLLWLYPDVLNLFGDRGNVMALLSIARAMGLEPELVKIDAAADLPDLADIDLIVMGAGQLRDMQTAAEDLRSQGDRLQAYAADGGHILVTGSTGCLLGKSFTLEGGEPIEGLGILDLTARELARTTQPLLTKEVYGDDIYWRDDEGLEVIGCQIQRMDFTLGAEGNPLGTVLYGYGNDLSGAEGARWKNVRFTNTVGPLLACAPWFGVKILTEIAQAKDIDLSAFREEDVPFMGWARAAFPKRQAFIANKKKLPGIVNTLGPST